MYKLKYFYVAIQWSEIANCLILVMLGSVGQEKDELDCQVYNEKC